MYEYRYKVVKLNIPNSYIINFPLYTILKLLLGIYLLIFGKDLFIIIVFHYKLKYVPINNVIIFI